MREVMEYDVVVVGAGPAGLATAIHLKQLAAANGNELTVCVLEKGSEVGSHTISGCVMDPRALNELIPDWQQLNFPPLVPVTNEQTLWLTPTSSFKLPLPSAWNNQSNYILSLSQLVRRLAEYAEELGVEIYPGFAAASPLIENGRVCGIITGDMGLDRKRQPTVNFQLGVEIRAKQTVIAEGCRGSVAKQIIAKFNLAANSAAQTYGLGIKEVWRVDSARHQLGQIKHLLGYPLGSNAYGGGFIYHMADNLVAVGLVTALDYRNPYLNPYEEFQRFKLHPGVAAVLTGGERLEYGARTVVEGGIQALPELTFPGGVLVGDSAGFLNVPKIKGVHAALKSGMLAATAILPTLAHEHSSAPAYSQLFRKSWLYQELYAVRNIRPAFRYGPWLGLIYTGIEYYVLRGKAWWTFRLRQNDAERLQAKAQHVPFNYLPYDHKLTFDKASSLHLANLNHDDSQPVHLCLREPQLAIKVNLAKYASPETRYCPAGVYEIIKVANQPTLQINSQNCVHCKACDIKDPLQNITWTVPEAGSGPQYSDM